MADYLVPIARRGANDIDARTWNSEPKTSIARREGTERKRAPGGRAVRAHTAVNDELRAASQV